jgi:phosphoribosyl-dephospho-CoA transferase
MNAIAMSPAYDRPLRPHDLLWGADTATLTSAEPLPDWVTAEWLSRAPVVVRRENAGPGRIPVGLRGATRSERFKAYLAPHAVLRRVSPEDLAAGRAWRDHAGDIPAMAALAALAPALDATGLAWGPTGGAGFALASGLPVLRPDSDLDLVLRAPAPLTTDQREMLARLRVLGSCRLDIQIDTGRGAFAFAEWISGRRRILLKTDLGPLLTDDPWSMCPTPRAEEALTR